MPHICTEIVTPARRVSGVVRPPGDKSISHRYAVLAALADGRSRFTSFAPGADAAATLACLRDLGVEVRTSAGGPGEGPTVELQGRGLRGLRSPASAIDAKNSGTTLRLLTGVLAAHPLRVTITGDASLRRRPMRRVIDPLMRMGAHIESADGRPPLTILGGPLTAMDHTLAVPSAQVKGAILLAGLQSEGRTIVRVPGPTRDHTERALRAFGARVDVAGSTATLEGPQPLRGLSARVAGDISSAAFLMVAAAALPGSVLEIAGVGLNPTRTAMLDVLRRAGAGIDVQIEQEAAGEPIGRVQVRSGALRPITVAPAEVPDLIDELPALAAIAAHGGEVTVTGAAELRVKESDRITALVAGLRALGVEAEEYPDGFAVRAHGPIRGGTADAAGDHRLAMAFAVAALAASGPCTITGAESVDISYPGFFQVLRSLSS
jgi:3-phosphoshikimate 1-carboxyvinyltransferase